jgi:hypothetical protein
MTAESENLDALATLAHRGILAALAACAVAVMFLPDAGSDAAPPPVFITVAMVGAVAAVILRRLSTSPIMSSSARGVTAIMGYALALVVGGAALTLSLEEAQRQNALLFAVGAIILCLRPPARYRAPSRSD